MHGENEVQCKTGNSRLNIEAARLSAQIRPISNYSSTLPALCRHSAFIGAFAGGRTAELMPEGPAILQLKVSTTDGVATWGRVTCHGSVQLFSVPPGVIPHSGLVAFIEFLQNLGYAAQDQAWMPFRLTRPNALTRQRRDARSGGEWLFPEPETG
jgi:hypothetical protein